MTKLALLGAAVAIGYATLAAPATAQHRATHVNGYAHGVWCTHEAGNPFSKEEDYQAWSAWRGRGGWDDRLDPNCGPARSRYGF